MSDVHQTLISLPFKSVWTQMSYITIYQYTHVEYSLPCKCSVFAISVKQKISCYTKFTKNRKKQ